MSCARWYGDRSSDDYVAVGDLVNFIKYFPENILLITGVLAKK